MNLYKFQCTVWVQGESVEEALEKLHDEVGEVIHNQDGYVKAIESDKGEFDTTFD
jgi:hypothetical protein